MKENKLTQMEIDCCNWYDQLPLWQKIIATILSLKDLYRGAYSDGWDSREKTEEE